MNIIVDLLAIYGLYCLLFRRQTKYTIQIKTKAPKLPKNTIEFSDPNGESSENIAQERTCK